MSLILVSPNEPKLFTSTFESSTVCENYGMDFLIPGKMGMIGVQRKTIGDLLASVSDGRLTTQLAKSAELTVKVLILEGGIRTTIDGYLMDHSFGGRQWHRSSIIKMQLTMQMHGYWMLRTKDKNDTVYNLERIHEWCNADKHTTGLSRPGPQKDSWGRGGKEIISTHILMGWPSIGQGTAQNIYDSFGCVPVKFSRPTQHILNVPGLGKHRVNKMMEVMDYGTD